MRYVYWDTNCFLTFLQNEEPNVGKILGVVERVEKGELMIATSTFTLVEVVKYKGKGDTRPRYPMGSDERLALDQCFGEQNGVRLVNVDLMVARLAREAIWDYGVDPKDAVHVGSAMYFSKAAKDIEGQLLFQSFDKKLVKHCSGRIDGIEFEVPDGARFPYQTSMGLSAE